MVADRPREVGRRWGRREVAGSPLVNDALPGLTAPLQKVIDIVRHNNMYSARRLMGSRIIESAAYCNQISLSQVYIDRAQITSVN
jgi:hypothetical protein